MQWTFVLWNGTKKLILKAERIYESNQIERFKISISDRFIILQNDRPLIISQNGRKKVNWKLIEGQIKNEDTFKQIIPSIEAYLKSLDKTPYIHPKNAT